ncbi:MAG: DUF1631 family protein [Pseudomonadales bacterium]
MSVYRADFYTLRYIRVILSLVKQGVGSLVSEVIEKLQKESVNLLCGMLQDVLAQAEREVVDQIGEFLSLSQKKDEIVAVFADNLNGYFDDLLGKESKKQAAVINFETLSIIQEDEMDVMVALEGMVAHSRNQHLPSYISFNTRLASVLPDSHIDEATNPLDPHQVATAFQEAIRPLGMDAENSLSVFRVFNQRILRHLDEVIHEANQVLIDHDVMPDLKMDGTARYHPAVRRQRRDLEPTTTFGTVEKEDYRTSEEQPEMFSVMQNLLHTNDAEASKQPETGPSPDAQQYAIPAGMMPSARSPGGGAPMQPFTPADGQQVQMVNQAQLLEILSNIQKSLDQGARATTDTNAAPLDIAESLGEMLQEGQDEDAVPAIDSQSSDIINLVTMLYEAIWDDDAVPIPIKELIGRTQITIIKVALSDSSFFNREDHPARVLLNEFASAGIGWTEVERLEEDSLYQKMQELVTRTLEDYSGDNQFFEDLLNDFKQFQAKEVGKTRRLEQRILQAKEREDRLEDIRSLVDQKISERILGRDLHPFVQELIEGPFHKFMVMLVLKEGPGGNAWKQAINTIDVLLWSVQGKEHHGDRERLETVNPRLLNNLRKAFRIAALDNAESDQLITRLQEVQDESFQKDDIDLIADEDRSSDSSLPSPVDEAKTATDSASAANVAEADLPDDDPHLDQVDHFTAGIWVEFTGEDDQTTVRCKLAAKINAIDKFIFVNRQGVKVVEKTRMGLARELKDGTVRLITEGPLFSRALETVIGNLREAQQRQHTSSAYQPTS